MPVAPAGGEDVILPEGVPHAFAVRRLGQHCRWCSQQGDGKQNDGQEAVQAVPRSARKSSLELGTSQWAVDGEGSRALDSHDRIPSEVSMSKRVLRFVLAPMLILILLPAAARSEEPLADGKAMGESTTYTFLRGSYVFGAGSADRRFPERQGTGPTHFPPWLLQLAVEPPWAMGVPQRHRLRDLDQLEAVRPREQSIQHCHRIVPQCLHRCQLLQCQLCSESPLEVRAWTRRDPLVERGNPQAERRDQCHRNATAPTLWLAARAPPAGKCSDSRVQG